MAVIHTREPSKFTDSQYGAFAISVTTFLESDYSLPHRPDHLVASQKTLQEDFNAKYDLYNDSDKERDEANKAYLDVIKALITIFLCSLEKTSLRKYPLKITKHNIVNIINLGGTNMPSTKGNK